VVLKRRAELAATSRADDLALRALAEIVEITGDENVRIVGGQMVSLLLAAFPVAGIAARRTRDADAAITTELAGSGVLHDRLVARGWAPSAGNHYVRPVPELSISSRAAPELSVDLLVPSLDGRFRPSQHGGRAFDSAPGLAPALVAEPVEVETRVRLLDGSGLMFVARVPTVEMAVVIKAYAYASRRLGRDVEDIYRLLEIVEGHPPDAIGGWRLDTADLRGSRRDAAARLQELGRRSRRLTNVGISAARLATLIAQHVRDPDS
jgi:hypothetical protein